MGNASLSSSESRPSCVMQALSERAAKRAGRSTAVDSRHAHTVVPPLPCPPPMTTSIGVAAAQRGAHHAVSPPRRSTPPMSASIGECAAGRRGSGDRRPANPAPLPGIGGSRAPAPGGGSGDRGRRVAIGGAALVGGRPTPPSSRHRGGSDGRIGRSRPAAAQRGAPHAVFRPTRKSRRSPGVP